MSTSKLRRSKAYRPRPEALEGRQLLSSVVRGVDVDGDTYTLSLVGPGVLRVLNQPGSDGTRVPIGQPGLIDSITVLGTNPGRSRLVGVVEPGPEGDGKVFFQNLNELPSNIPQAVDGVGIGMLAIDMPDFWLGDTSPAPGGGQNAGAINVPGGVVTLNFGGVDTTAFGRSTNGQADQFTVTLGLPNRIGTSVIVDQIITANETDASGSEVQDTVRINVSGRINVFQANSIEGDETLDLADTFGRFEGDNPGGTTIVSQASGTAFGQGLTGAIGRFRIGGDATNLTVRVQGQQDGRLTNFSIGGETNKVTLDVPVLIRNAQFGLGMDTVSINTNDMQSLSANRGAVGSSMIIGRNAGRLTFGGDIFNTRVLAGYLTDPSGTPVAQAGGQMTVLAAGLVFDSIFAASVEPVDGIFGNADDLVQPQGFINAKVEGLIDNSTNPEVDPITSFDQAFFAARVRLESGPVVPPGAPAPPFRPAPGPGRTPGVRGLSGGFPAPTFEFVRRNNRRLNPVAPNG